MAKNEAGIVSLICGVILLVYSLEANRSFEPTISQPFSGTLSLTVIVLIILGIVFMVIGGMLLCECIQKNKIRKGKKCLAGQFLSSLWQL